MLQRAVEPQAGQFANTARHKTQKSPLFCGLAILRALVDGCRPVAGCF